MSGARPGIAAVNAIKEALREIAFFGVVPGIDPVFAKRIILTNLLGLLFAVNMSASAIAFLAFGYPLLALFTFFFVLSEISWPILNRSGHYKAARLGMLVSSNLLGLAVSVMLPGTGYDRGFYVMAGLPILLFGLEEKRSIALGLLLPVALYPFSEWAQSALPVGLEISSETTLFIRHAIGIIYVVLIFLMFLFLSMENARAEQSLKLALDTVESEKRKIIELNNALEEQRAKAFSSSKFAALGEMASGMGHEINNPMTVIAVGADRIKTLLSRPELDRERIGELASKVKSMVQRITRIIEALQNFSRNGERDPYETTSVQSIVADTLTFCSERFKSRGIRLEVSLPESDLLIECRAVQISQILLNLLNNAYDALEKASDEGVRLEAYRNEAAGTVSIRLTDFGQGVPPEDRERIFQPFYTTKPIGRGTGLGLSVSRAFARNHGGELLLDLSSPGTTFVLELPIRQAERSGLAQ